MEKTLQSAKTRALTLLIEHGPCCILSFAAGFVGLAGLTHNPLLEFGFAMGGALVGEYVGHKLFHKGAVEENRARRYALALAIGVISWALHQMFIHG